MRNSLFEILNKFLQKCKIRINPEELKLQILSHPSYPSLYAVTDVLNYFEIGNLAIELPRKEEVIGHLPNVFFAIVDIENQREYSIIERKGNSLNISTDGKKYSKISIQEFLNIWSGISVVVEHENPDRIQGANNIKDNKVILKILFLSFSLGLFLLFYSSQPTLFEGIHFFLSAIGFCLSLLISQEELGYNSKFADGLCSVSKKVDCHAVLNSVGAKVFNLLKLSDLSLIYFSSLIFCWIINIHLPYTSFVFPVLSILSLFIVAYSLYYQYFKVKKWCPMCLSVGFVLLLQSLSILALEVSAMSEMWGNFRDNMVLFMVFGFVFSFWLFVKPFLVKEKEYAALNLRYLKFKRNFNLFDSLYRQNEVLGCKINVPEINFGKDDAVIKILLVTNPMCHFCRSAHHEVDKIISKYGDNIQLTIRFNVNTNDRYNMSYKISNILMTLYNHVSSETCKQAMDEVYEEGVNLNKWLAKWESQGSVENDNVLKAQQNWCHENKLNFTPALIINGRQFPQEYERTDLPYFMEDLIGSFKVGKIQNETELEKQYI